MRAQNHNGTLIGSAGFAQMPAECAYTLQWFAHFPLKIAPSHGGSGPHVVHSSILSQPQTTSLTLILNHNPTSPNRHMKKKDKKLECESMPNVMVALKNMGGTLCSTTQSLADAYCWSTVQ